MSSKEILAQALEIKAEERFMIVEGLLKSLDEPDLKLIKFGLRKLRKDY